MMKMFNMIGIGERAGSGIPGIYQIWKNEGWAMPVVEEKYNPDRTCLTLTFAKKQSIKTSEKNKTRKTLEKQDAIREYLQQNGSSKTSAMLWLKGQIKIENIICLMKVGWCASDTNNQSEELTA